MGHSRGGLIAKIRALVHADGRPVPVELTAGQAGDAPMATWVARDHCARRHRHRRQDLHTDGIRAFVTGRKAWANIPPRSIRKDTFAFSRWVYCQCNQMRRIATRCDRRANNFRAALDLAAMRLWIS